MPLRRHSLIIEKILQLPYSAFGILWGGLVLAFAAMYFGLGQWMPTQAPTPIGSESLWKSLGDSIYFSVITSTTVGYGDIIPQGFSKVLAAVQSVFAFFVFGLCISKLVSNKQEMAIRQMHKLTLEDVFRNTREGLYIVRKDFDHIMAQAEALKKIDEEHWENLAVAYKQAQSIIAEIPDFYRGDGDLYTIDERREQLLQEAVHRTLHRINQLIDVFARVGIDWIADSASVSELLSLVTLVHAITPDWKNNSPYTQHEAFEDILGESGKIHQRMVNVAA
ncbi:hypothetical protein A2881_03590 [Candidatus Peribacteria bacterium RIFCSPHIGHO2_01_FULL_55_13]|nr:MAG: hypothetical protein A2881_03590 [Candidatus Peribacteria bacterium RIFCSPHIGHO2_01_FULL_55_13]OGJ66663.1 MAG: hypothetical protein A3F36_02835 [Candidatus Peribacteria bacterium RIFCSPHIGHO2_12_FULL_55_11]